VSKSTNVRNVVLGDIGVGVTATVPLDTYIKPTPIYISNIKGKKSILAIVRIDIRNKSCNIYALS
jgi:hypothetical protein